MVRVVEEVVSVRDKGFFLSDELMNLTSLLTLLTLLTLLNLVGLSSVSSVSSVSSEVRFINSAGKKNPS